MGVKETSLYYLQSRYYNPKTGRFLNADAFVATGQGLIGNNMFAYCCNNPTSKIDPDGERLIPLVTARLIHNEVASRVAKAVGGTEGLYVVKEDKDGKIKRGFLDVYDSKTNSYYEIKSITSAFTSRTRKQMEKYDNSEPLLNSIGPISRGKEKVSGSFSFGIYDVNYRLVSDGLVAYTADINSTRASMAITLSLLAIGTVAVFSSGAGLIGLAFV